MSNWGAGPSSDGAFAGGLGDGFGGGVAEGEENVFGALGLVVGEVFHGFAEGGEAEVGVAIGAVEAVEEGRDLDEAKAGVHEVEVEDLLACHVRGGFIIRGEAIGSKKGRGKAKGGMERGGDGERGGRIVLLSGVGFAQKLGA